MKQLPIVTVREEWRERAEALTRLSAYAYASSYDNLFVGLLAEQAAIHYLVHEVADLPATWLSPTPGARRRGGGHPADVLWNGLEIDVKLVSRAAEHVKIKQNGQEFHHMFMAWHRRLESFYVLGVLLPFAPETFGVAVPLKHHVNRQTGPVTGWHVPITRLQPLSVLLNKEVA